MSMFDNLKNVLAQYTSGTASAQDAEAHFHEVSQSADQGTLAAGISETMRSDQTPPFGQLVSQLFANASPDQKAGMLNALLGALPAEQRSQFGGMIPGADASTSVSGTQASAVPPNTVGTIAERAEQHNPAIIDKMSTFYAQHPTLVKTLGTAAMMMVMRNIAARQNR